MSHRAALIALALVLGTTAPESAGAHARPSRTLVGTVRVVHSDDFRSDRAQFSYSLVVHGHRFALRKGGRSTWLRSGDRIRVRRGLIHVLRQAPVRRLAAANAGPRKVAVVLFNFANGSSQPFSPEQARAVMFTAPDSVNAYYREQSFGQVSFAGKLRSDGDVFGWYTIPEDSSGCQTQTWAQSARSAATKAGVDLSGYDHIVYAFPHAASCDWGGQAELPGSSSWINGAFNRFVVGHELGHNLGLDHASSLTCTDGGRRVAIGPSCTRSEYGDPFDVMGSGGRQVSSWHKGQLGWLAGPNTLTVSPAPGRYSIVPQESASLGVQALRIPRGDTGKYYYLEFRQPTGLFDDFAPTDPAAAGVSIRLAPDYPTVTQSLLVDTTPETDTFADAPLTVGRTFTDAAYGISITTTAATPVGATVVVGPPPPTPAPADSAPPSAPATITAQAEAGPSVTLRWSPAVDNSGVQGYRLYRNQEEIATMAGTTYSDTSVAAGDTFSYDVRAYDASGNLGTPSPSASVRLPLALRSAGNGSRRKPVKLSATGRIGFSARPRHGRRFAARIRVRRSDTGGVLRLGQIACSARIRGRPLAVAGKGFRQGRATCTWRIPHAAGGNRLRASIAVGFHGAYLRRRFSTRIR